MNNDSSLTTLVLGAEHDHRLRAALKAVLTELGARMLDQNWGVAGSQEVERTEVDVSGETLVVEAETYIGLTITGSPTLTARIKQLVASKLGNDTC